MVTKYDVIRMFEKHKDDPELKYTLDEDKKNIISKESGIILATLDEHISFLRKKLHCDFELIYDEHPSLFEVIRCKECGTVIFTRYDESYDPNLKCPTCGDYKTYFDFWTKAEIDADEEKQKAIKCYEEMQRELEESDARLRKRGLYDWEIWKKKIKFKKTMWEISLECNDFFHKPRLKGLKLHFTKWVKDPEFEGSYTFKKKIRIPLSWYAFYIRFVYPYSKKCTPEHRKYYFWQKKPEKQEKG